MTDDREAAGATGVTTVGGLTAGGRTVARGVVVDPDEEVDPDEDAFWRLLGAGSGSTDFPPPAAGAGSGPCA